MVIEGDSNRFSSCTLWGYVLRTSLPVRSGLRWCIFTVYVCESLWMDTLVVICMNGTLNLVVGDRWRRIRFSILFNGSWLMVTPSSFFATCGSSGSSFESRKHKGLCTLTVTMYPYQTASPNGLSSPSPSHSTMLQPSITSPIALPVLQRLAHPAASSRLLPHTPAPKLPLSAPSPSFRS